MRMRMHHVLGWLVVMPSMASAQLIAGRVLEDGANSPVADVEVVVIAADNAEVLRVVTDSTGEFRALLPQPGTYRLRVRHIAFVDYRSPELELDRGETLALEIRLGRSVVPLDPLVITSRARTAGRLAGFRERAESGRFGTFITRAEIERRPGAETTDLLRNVPGVMVQSIPRVAAAGSMMADVIGMRGIGTSSIAGMQDANWCLPALFVDGMRMEQSADTPIDDLLRPDVLEGVEVYNSAARVPIEYQQGGQNACGAVLFWTRPGDPSGGRSGWWRWALGVGAFGGVLFLMR